MKRTEINSVRQAIEVLEEMGFSVDRVPNSQYRVVDKHNQYMPLRGVFEEPELVRFARAERDDWLRELGLLPYTVNQVQAYVARVKNNREQERQGGGGA